MSQPEVFVKKGDENKVCLLKKSLYGLRQSSRQWYRKFDEHISKTGFTKSKFDSCVYIKIKKGQAVAYLLLYVDDMLVAGSCKEEVDRVKEDSQMNFEMKDLGDAQRILGIHIKRDMKQGRLWLSQADYVERVLKRFHMDKARGVSTPVSQHTRLSSDQEPKSEEDRKEMKAVPYANIVGSLMYTMICTRPDLAHAMSITNRYMANHGSEH